MHTIVKKYIPASLSALFFILLFCTASFMDHSTFATRLELRYQHPNRHALLGTDWLGRDMAARTIKGLCASIHLGISAALMSTFIAILFGLSAAMAGQAIDALINGFVTLFLSLPHLVLLILISFVSGGGTTGIIIAVAVTHWPRLCRIIRSEIMQLRSAPYVIVSTRFGKSPWWIARNHVIPHILQQSFVGMLLMFPHAILHAAELTFLGFGLNPHNPSLGVLLSESMRHLSTGYWWLAVFPGIALVIVIKAFESIGVAVKKCFDPRTAQE